MMSLIIRYSKEWGGYSTHRIEVPIDANVDILKNKISETFQVSKNKLIMSCKRDGFMVYSPLI